MRQEEENKLRRQLEEMAKSAMPVTVYTASGHRRTVSSLALDTSRARHTKSKSSGYIPGVARLKLKLKVRFAARMNFLSFVVVLVCSVLARRAIQLSPSRRTLLLRCHRMITCGRKKRAPQVGGVRRNSLRCRLSLLSTCFVCICFWFCCLLGRLVAPGVTPASAAPTTFVVGELAQPTSSNLRPRGGRRRRPGTRRRRLRQRRRRRFFQHIHEPVPQDTVRVARRRLADVVGRSAGLTGCRGRRHIAWSHRRDGFAQQQPDVVANRLRRRRQRRRWRRRRHRSPNKQ